MHQQRPGRMINNPKPMNPTPMIVADDRTPRDIVMATGTMPTRAMLPPMPTITNGPRNEDITDDGIRAFRGLRRYGNMAAADSRCRVSG